ncbi:hypothetical protein [Mesorhizobium sp. KR2-14]|uniref:hypothetical protein n=1 Tax=Mesorhizobium sp. KR2-14 TaxID=3156610 RepID=UPI0032B42521
MNLAHGPILSKAGSRDFIAADIVHVAISHVSGRIEGAARKTDLVNRFVSFAALPGRTMLALKRGKARKADAKPE